MRIIFLADTHTLHRNIKVPDGDMIVHAGDVSGSGTVAQLEEFFDWFRGLPHRHKVIVAGNHDWLFELNNDRAREMAKEFVYLQDESVVVEGVKLYGSPWQPWFNDWAFNLDRGAPLKAKWDIIPPDTDILITHGPPHGIGDKTDAGELAGCEDLLRAVLRIQPKAHVFGHIHEGYGIHRRKDTPTVFVNASICDASYNPINKPVVMDV